MVEMTAIKRYITVDIESPHYAVVCLICGAVIYEYNLDKHTAWHDTLLRDGKHE